MRRFIALILVVSSIGFAPPPASSAVVTLSLTPASLTVVEGSSTTLRGFARGVRLGSVVRLQRKVGTGWATVKERRLRTNRSYAFTIRPRRGIHRYRVVKPRQLGQAKAVSPTSTVTVTWRPPTTLETFSELLYDVDIQLRVEGVPDTWIREQRRYHPEAAWVTSRWVRLDSAGEYRETMNDARYELRYVVPADGLRLETVSPAVLVTHDGESSHQITPPGVGGPDGDQGAVAIRAVAGEEMYLAIADDTQQLTGREDLIRPDGTLERIAFRRSAEGMTAHWVPERTGWYTLQLGAVPAVVTVSYPKQVPVVLNGDRPLVWPLAAGQPVDLVFDGRAGDVVSWGPGPARDCVVETLYGPDGTVTAPFIRGGVNYQSGWMLAATGEHRLRVAPCAPHELDESFVVHRAEPVALPLDGAAKATSSRAGQTLVAEIDLQAGTRILAATSGGRWTPLLTVLDPAGRHLHSARPNWDSGGSPGMVTELGGVHRVVYWSDDAGPSEVDLTASTPLVVESQLDPRRPVPVTTTMPRELGVTFTGTTGTFVYQSVDWHLIDERRQTLLGPDGRVVLPTYTLARRVWRLPADGTYTLLSAGKVDGEVAARTPTAGPELARNATTRLSVREPAETVVSRLTATAGEKLTLEVTGDTFPSYGVRGQLVLDVYGPSGQMYRVATPTVQEPYSPVTIDVPETGTYQVLLQGWYFDSTGSVDVRVDVG